MLNSLAADLLLASLDCLATFGHFCEIGKFDIQQNTQIGLRALERNVSFHAIDLSEIFNQQRVWTPLRELISEGIASGEVQPISHTMHSDLADALRTLSGGRHTGKIVVQAPPLSSVFPITRRRFSTCGTHLVIGGLGGYGVELVRWLQARGASKVVVVSRRRPGAIEIDSVRGADIVTADLREEASCDALVESLADRLTGVWQLAMVLKDGLFMNMSEESWREVVEAKAQLTINLDRSTRKFAKDLRHFVCWSSVVAQRGNAGQSNYAYANSSMESLCSRRREEGLCGLAIQWGLIGGVGIMADKAVSESFRFAPQHIDNCLDTLDDLLFSSSAVVTSYLPYTPRVETSESLKLSDRVARALGVSASRVRPDDSLVSLGMDSLQSIEVSNLLKAAGAETKDLKSMSWKDILAFDV